MLICCSLLVTSLLELCADCESFFPPPPPPLFFFSYVANSTHIAPSRGTKTFGLVSDVHLGLAVKNTHVVIRVVFFFMPKPVCEIKKLVELSKSQIQKSSPRSFSLHDCIHSVHSDDCITQRLSSGRENRLSKYIQQDLINDPD